MLAKLEMLASLNRQVEKGLVTISPPGNMVDNVDREPNVIHKVVEMKSVAP